MYANLGWDGIIAIQPDSKVPAESGTTGRYPQLAAEECIWRACIFPRANLALRLPENMLAIDVDAHGDKQGAATITEFQKRFGKLPPAPYSTARGAGTSGIRLYRTRTPGPFVSRIKPDVDIIQHGYRFVMAWPSVHPKTGEEYAWYSGAHQRLSAPPRPSDAPLLPAGVERRLRAWATEPVPAPTVSAASRVEALPGLRRALRAAADRLAALPVGSAANDPCNFTALEFSKYAPIYISADEIRDVLRAAVATWTDGREAGYAAIEQGLSVINTPKHRPRPWVDVEGAGFNLVKG